MNVELKAELLYWIELDCTGVPNKLAGDCKGHSEKDTRVSAKSCTLLHMHRMSYRCVSLTQTMN